MNKYFPLSVFASAIATGFLSALSEQAQAQNTQRHIEQIKHTKTYLEIRTNDGQ
jgi:hypothetical protein